MTLPAGDLDRERLEADQRYNAALTALDRAVVAVSTQATASPEALAHLGTALLVFLQHITAFVETKDRQLAADAARRIDALGPTLEAVAELRAQVSLLQRATDAQRRATSPVASRQSSVVSQQSSVVGQQSSVVGQQSSVVGQQSPVVGPGDDYKYVGFEDEFRGSSEIIQERLRAYMPLFEGYSNVLDIGCGRGELLSALRGAGVAARGIDTNADMVAIARERGLDAHQADALAYVSALPDGSLGGLAATQVIEHLEPSYLMRLLDQAARTLGSGAPIVLETINPACWLAFFSSYIRDFTHRRPIHPETLQYLLRASGFERVSIRYSAPVPEHMKMKTIDLPTDVLRAADPAAKALAQIAHTLNANAAILNNLMFSHLDYAAIGYRC